MTRLRGTLDPEAGHGHSADHGYEAVRLEWLQPAGVPHDGGRDGRLRHANAMRVIQGQRDTELIRPDVCVLVVGPL